MKTDKKRKKAKTVVIVIFVLLAVLAVALIAVDLFSPKVGFTDRRDDIFYFPVDYNENIYDDLVYMSKYRDIRFDYYGTAIYITEENLSVQSPEAKFFYDYFKTVINGEYGAYKDLFTKDFFSDHSIPEKFTMQKIYDIEISAMTSDVEDGVAYETFKVSYKIYENNGTFRADVSSNESKPVAIILRKGSELKISSIIPII